MSLPHVARGAVTLPRNLGIHAGEVHAILYGTQGVETCILWRWFAVPLGAPALGLWDAVGFALIVGSVTYAPRVESKVGVEVTGRLQRAGIRLAVGFVCWIAMGGWR